jgi:hypothetical protein
MTAPLGEGRELELVRSRDDRRLYVIADVGSIRLEGLFGRNASVEAGGERWTFRRATWTRTIEAVDASGVFGAFHGRLLNSGGSLRWGEREYTLRKASVWREHYALVDGDRELALFEVRAWGRTPVRIGLESLDAVEKGLLLFAAFVVRSAADDNSTTAVVASTVATSGG